MCRYFGPKVSTIWAHGPLGEASEIPLNPKPLMARLSEPKKERLTTQKNLIDPSQNPLTARSVRKHPHKAGADLLVQVGELEKPWNAARVLCEDYRVQIEERCFRGLGFRASWP